MFFIGLTILSDFTNGSYLNAIALDCISMKNQECQTRPQVVNANGDEPVFFPFIIETSKCSGSCDNINYQCAKICVPDVLKSLNVKVFNLMLRTNEARYREWDESCKCECKFRENICNNKQRSNKNVCKCECKELIDKGVSYKVFIWNPINFEFECDKACDIGEYLDYEHCKYRKKLVKKLFDECTETVEEVKLARITYAENENCYKCSSRTVYYVLFWIFFTINDGGKGAYFIYFCGYLKRLFTRETTIY